MTSLSDVAQDRWLNACKKLGLEVIKRQGKGSHAMVKGGNLSGRPLIIQHKLNPVINKKIYRQLLNLGFTKEQIDKALK